MRVLHRQPDIAVNLSADGSTLAFTDDDDTVYKLALLLYELLFIAPVHKKRITGVTLSTDESLLCTVGRDQFALFLGARTSALIQTIITASTS